MTPDDKRKDPTLDCGVPDSSVPDPSVLAPSASDSGAPDAEEWVQQPTVAPPPGDPATANSGRRPRKPQISLVLYHREGADIVPLSPRARLVIGRFAEADLAIPEPTLSRQHARVERIGDDVWIEDLGSSNKTRVNGEVIKRARLDPGDDVQLGELVLSIHTTASYSRSPEHHAQFLAVLNEEVTRAQTFGHQLALLLVRSSSHGTDERWQTGVRQMLRPVDRMATQGPGSIEILMPETNLSAARKLAVRLTEAFETLRCGVATYPGSAETGPTLIEAARKALDAANLDCPVIAPTEPPREAVGIGASAPLVCGVAMRSVYETVGRVASSRYPVLLYGETGSGKEMVARAIHEAGPRQHQPMRSINCGALPRELVQSTLFGHERGSFTGASQQAKGVFEDGDGSTLLLDEVGELPPEAQVALLRVLETGRLTRVGSTREVPVDVRVISATHRDLEAMCEAGEFRWDLFYRLNTITISIPPLRQRLDEIDPLVEHFLAQAGEKSGLLRKKLAADAMSVLRSYLWPGNVRELRNAIERAVLVSSGQVITIDDLPDRVRAVIDQTWVNDTGRLMRPRDPTPGMGSATVKPAWTDRQSFKHRVHTYEMTLIRRAMRRTAGNKAAAARQLQMPLRTLVNKVAVHGLAPVDSTGSAVHLPGDDESLVFRARVQQFEQTLLLDALRETDWNKAEAARRLDLPLSTLLYKIKNYALDARG